MRALIAAAALLGFAAPLASAAENTNRTYPNPACAERGANAADCVIQDGPPRRSAFGPLTPPVKGPPTPTPTPVVPSGPSGSGVSILGGDGKPPPPAGR